MIRLLKLLSPETAHNLTIFLLSIGERWDDLLWWAERKRTELRSRNLIIRLRREVPLS